eukprot:scaffold211916_cov31-Tisochrysis_lutea.AAC.4
MGGGRMYMYRAPIFALNAVAGEGQGPAACTQHTTVTRTGGQRAPMHCMRIACDRKVRIGKSKKVA